MAQKTIITTVTIGVHDPEQDVAEIRDANGQLLRIGTRGLAHVPPGHPVTLDADEADRIIARFGGEELDDDEPDADGASRPAAPRRRSGR